MYLRFTVAAALLAATAWPAAAADKAPVGDLRQNLFSSCFIGDQEGWMVGDLGRLYRTMDGGKTWEWRQSETKQSFVTIACPDKGHLFAAGQAGMIAESTDSGATWKLQKSGTDRQLLSIAFPTAQRGLAVGDFGTMVRTDDGGATWTKVTLPTDIKLPADVADVVDPGDVVLYGASFADPDHAWVVGEFGVILHSEDGGQTWHPQTSPVESSLFGVSFADQQRGWAVGIEATLLATTDGGMNWRKSDIETPKGFQLALYDVQVRGNYGWAAGNSGFMLNSTDAGATWQRVKVPVQMGSSWLRGVTLFPDGRGFIVGAKGLVVTTNQSKFIASKERL